MGKTEQKNKVAREYIRKYPEKERTNIQIIVKYMIYIYPEAPSQFFSIFLLSYC